VGAKLILGQVAFKAIPFLTVWIEYEHGRCPHRVETVEIGSVFLDVCLERHEVVVDE
jgi:hypothetical protein